MDTFKHRWHQLPISRQLLVLVNAILFGFVVLFLIVDYRLRMDRHLNEKQIALTEEAKTMYESLLVAEAHGGDAIQDLVDNVCARMNTDDSPGHHIAADWRGLPYQAISHGHASDKMLSAMRLAADSVSTKTKATGSLVVGAFTGPAGTVYISEKRSAVVGATRRSLVLQMFAVLLLGAITAFVVSTVLRQLIAKPIQGLVSALQSVASGDLSVIARTRSCRELSYLADQLNAMTEALDHAQRDHRVHMEKARQIQQNLRPTVNGLVGIDVAELFEPADDVGGDYYDVIPLSDGRYLLCVADVSGHGVPAAMAATLLKAFVSEAAKKSSSPAEILTDVNQRYCEYVMMGHFATMALLVVDPKNRQLTYANAGHEFPFLQ
ncbi:MAG: SpoIIE family protein phosphatase, partial [Planctomycetaceae bacterium]|nr:SpoIIE family protein phosphatase [Planctomycetaceae bacterium]